MIHKPGTSNHADPLTRQSHRQVSDADDNNDVVVLKPEHFQTIAALAFAEVKEPALEKKIRDCTDRETEVAEALKVLQKKGPTRLVNGTLEWEEADGLLWEQAGQVDRRSRYYNSVQRGGAQSSRYAVGD